MSVATLTLAEALHLQRERLRHGAQRRVAVAVVTRDTDHAAALIDGAIAALERMR